MVARYHTIFGAGKPGLVAVEAAHMEFAEPSISTAFDRCAAKGARHIICYPFFLSRGQHVQVDVPALLKEAALRYPHITHEVTDPLGTQVDGLLALIDHTVSTAISNPAQALPSPTSCQS